MANKYYLNEALEELGEVLTKEMRRLVPVDTGKLRDSISFYVENDVLVFLMEDYADAVNEGTRPHRPPISAIEGWSKRKGLNPWAVADKIEKFGTRPNNFMEPLEDFERDYFDLLENATYEALEGYVWEKISKYKK